jgi:hypothetical protein
MQVFSMCGIANRPSHTMKSTLSQYQRQVTINKEFPLKSANIASLTLGASNPALISFRACR